jgi:hypothetical protein
MSGVTALVELGSLYHPSAGVSAERRYTIRLRGGGRRGLQEKTHARNSADGEANYGGQRQQDHRAAFQPNPPAS